MAQKVQVVLIDDVDGGEAAETVTFGLDGVTYEIDVSVEHANQLRESLAGWVASGRRVSGRSKSGTRKTGSSDDTAAIRNWAKENGHQV
ncbi:MAG: histone-like nucleoid-structuring protein Lsr2, partial [Angustibacter sp.]